MRIDRAGERFGSGHRMVGPLKTLKALGAATLLGVAISLVFGGGVQESVLSAFLSLNALLVLGFLVWT